MRLGIYVGTFNPPHKGHIKIANHLLINNYVDKVVIISTGSYWDKKDILPFETRISMLKCYEFENIIINDTLNELPYTYLILNELKKLYPDDELYLIIGSDNLANLHLWKNVHEVLKHKILVIPRTIDDYQELISKISKRHEFVVVKDFPFIDISSTKIRECLKEGNLEESLKYLDYFVLLYIIVNNLYDVNLNDFYELSLKNL